MAVIALLFPTIGNAQSTPLNMVFIICDQMKEDAFGAIGNNGLYPDQTVIQGHKHDDEWLSFTRLLPWHLIKVVSRIGYVGKNHTNILSLTSNGNFEGVKLVGIAGTEKNA